MDETGGSVSPHPGLWAGRLIQAKSQKPKAKSQKPKDKSQKPKAKSQKPKAKSQKPSAIFDDLNFDEPIFG
jgi:hypothetical protein